MKHAANQGQTLIEIVVATGMVMLVLVTVVAGVVLSIRNTRFAKQQALATRYAQEGIEWSRRQRDELGWQPFRNAVSADGDPVTYCLNTLPSTTTEFEALTGGECGEGTTIGTTNFQREVTIDLDTSTADIQVVISWQEGTRTHQSQLTSQLTEWED